MIYLDYAASAIKRKNIIEEMLNHLDEFDGNPDSMHQSGRQARKWLEQARAAIATSINASPSEIVFTSGASEANNMVIQAFDDKDMSILTTEIEHPSVLEPLKKSRAKLLHLKANHQGNIDIKSLSDSLSQEPDLFSMMYVNNETGVILPADKVKELKKDKTWFHLDAVQAYGHLDIDVKALNVDSMSLSGHKIGGLNGFGVLYLKQNLPALIFGGNQEKNRRAGTSNLYGAYTMAKAYEDIYAERDKLKELKSYFVQAFNKASFPSEFNGDISNSVTHILNVYLPFTQSDFLLTYLDMNGICASAGSACTAGSLEPSHVIIAMHDEKRARQSIRFSLGYTNTRDDIDYVIKTLHSLYERSKNEG